MNGLSALGIKDQFPSPLALVSEWDGSVPRFCLQGTSQDSAVRLVHPTQDRDPKVYPRVVTKHNGKSNEPLQNDFVKLVRGEGGTPHRQP